MKKMLVIFILACSIAFADPIVFSLELGKTTEKELKEMFPAKVIGVNKWNGGRMYSISSKNIDFEGLLEDVLLVCNTEDILVALQAKFPKERFHYLQQALESKYNLVLHLIAPFRC